MVFTGPIDVLRVRSGLRKATMMDKGLNNARCVFLKKYSCFFYTKRYLQLLLMY
jgi:hypothetical protein